MTFTAISAVNGVGIVTISRLEIPMSKSGATLKKTRFR